MWQQKDSLPQGTSAHSRRYFHTKVAQCITFSYNQTIFVSTNLFVHFNGIHNQVNDIKVFHQFKILLWKKKRRTPLITCIKPSLQNKLAISLVHWVNVISRHFTFHREWPQCRACSFHQLNICIMSSHSKANVFKTTLLWHNLTVGFYKVDGEGHWQNKGKAFIRELSINYT